MLLFLIGCTTKIQHSGGNCQISPYFFTRSVVIKKVCTFVSNTQQVKNITIVNMTGQTVIEELGTGNKTMVISTQHLLSGIFFVTLKNNEGVQITKKLIKK